MLLISDTDYRTKHSNECNSTAITLFIYFKCNNTRNHCTDWERLVVITTKIEAKQVGLKLRSTVCIWIAYFCILSILINWTPKKLVYIFIINKYPKQLFGYEMSSDRLWLSIHSAFAFSENRQKHLILDTLSLVRAQFCFSVVQPLFQLPSLLFLSPFIGPVVIEDHPRLSCYTAWHSHQRLPFFHSSSTKSHNQYFCLHLKTFLLLLLISWR